MSVFDIERARDGDVVEYRIRNDTWEEVHFVGTAIIGRPVVEFRNSDMLVVSESNLRMAPKVRTMWVQVYAEGTAVFCTHPYSDKLFAKAAAGDCRLLGEPQPIQIEEE